MISDYVTWVFFFFFFFLGGGGGGKQYPKSLLFFVLEKGQEHRMMQLKIYVVWLGKVCLSFSETQMKKHNVAALQLKPLNAEWY